ncbi:hypothetical protein LS74_008935 [Helicobacter magdeburgensis]|uniref:Lipoprotein n=1 Tax=Helicobacter magdeburgensis TaxID=471858 RepID=A0A4U8SWP0_9HELI|nr:hypothetical protein [Helicobacter magdeburgensis]TLD91359.1 hypothetical protein LS74_008935 [Helicobacter magdeburgensis]
MKTIVFITTLLVAISIGALIGGCMETKSKIYLTEEEYISSLAAEVLIKEMCERVELQQKLLERALKKIEADEKFSYHRDIYLLDVVTNDAICQAWKRNITEYTWRYKIEKSKMEAYIKGAKQ